LKTTQPKESSKGRYERKLRVTAVEREWVELLIRRHPDHLVEIFPPRFINNIYLDTFRYTHYFDHINGYSRRRKVRVRWYGDLDGDLLKPQLEIKSKVGWVIMKQNYPLRPAALSELLTANSVLRLGRDNGSPEVIREIVSHLQPTLVNRYRRRYFGAVDRKVRVTVDDKMSFYRPHKMVGKSPEKYVDSAIVVEIKYSENDVKDGVAVAAHFPLPLNKNSKYVSGVQHLNGEAF
jgi:hypothetical protein